MSSLCPHFKGLKLTGPRNDRKKEHMKWKTLHFLIRYHHLETCILPKLFPFSDTFFVFSVHINSLSTFPNFFFPLFVHVSFSSFLPSFHPPFDSTFIFLSFALFLSASLVPSFSFLFTGYFSPSCFLLPTFALNCFTFFLVFVLHFHWFSFTCSLFYCFHFTFPLKSLIKASITSLESSLLMF